MATLESPDPQFVPLLEPVAGCKPAPKPELTVEQEAKYDGLLEQARAIKEIQCGKEKDKSGPITDRERAWLSRECLLRYLRATKWNVAEAAKRLHATLVWRREYGLNDFTPKYISPEQETGKQMIFGFDKQGRPCQYLNPNRQNTEPSPRQIHHLFYMVERVVEMMPPGVESMTLMINFKPTKERKNTGVPIQTAREVVNILQNHYPERLGKALIINVPWLVWGFFKLVMPLLDPVTQDKVKFNEDMKQYVPAEHLWKADWGGELDFQYDHEIYWGALNDICDTRREERLRRWAAAGKQVGESEEYMAAGTNLSVCGFIYASMPLSQTVLGVDEKLVEKMLEESEASKVYLKGLQK